MKGDHRQESQETHKHIEEDRKLKVNINIPMKGEQRQESQETHKHIEEDRKLLIQVIVIFVLRIVKSGEEYLVLVYIL